MSTPEKLALLVLVIVTAVITCDFPT